MSTLSVLRFSPLPVLRSSLPRSPTLQLPHPNPSSKPKKRTLTISMSSYNNSYNSYSPIPSTDRLISALSYTLPFINSISYGRFLFSQYPVLLQPLAPFLPLVSALHSLPLGGFIAFFALYLGVVRNSSFSRFVRFNAMQAVVLDVLLSIPSLLHRVFGMPVRGPAFKAMVLGYDVIFLFAAGCFFYSLFSCVLGRTPYLPIVATAADRQL